MSQRERQRYPPLLRMVVEDVLQKQTDRTNRTDPYNRANQSQTQEKIDRTSCF